MCVRASTQSAPSSLIHVVISTRCRALPTCRGPWKTAFPCRGYKKKKKKRRKTSTCSERGNTLSSNSKAAKKLLLFFQSSWHNSDVAKEEFCPPSEVLISISFFFGRGLVLAVVILESNFWILNLRLNLELKFKNVLNLKWKLIKNKPVGQIQTKMLSRTGRGNLFDRWGHNGL